MKTLIKSVIALAIVLTGFGNLKAQTVSSKKEKAEFKVYGECGMCKTRIEKASKDVEGVNSASWDTETKMLSVEYDPGKVTLTKIHQAVAKAGHDTEREKADDETYNKLPGCCQYERAKYEK